MTITKRQLAMGIVGLVASASSLAGPEDERKAFQQFYFDRFSQVTDRSDFKNGVYSILPEAREQWEQIEEFPPYELAIEEGQALFETPFANGKSLADCFPNGGIGIRQNYPYFDTARGEVITLELAINECREANGEKPYPWKKGPLAAVSSYMAYTSRDAIIDVKIPEDPRALAAFEDGKMHYYTKRGQLNFACADCHMYGSGQNLRSETLSMSYGHTTGFPVYRAKWQEVGTLHRRLAGCHESVRAKAYKAQGPEYRNLEYFLAYMSSGLEINGPSARK